MKNYLYIFSRFIISIVLTKETGNTISASLYKFKNKYKWIYRVIYGTITDEEIFKHIRQKLNDKYDILMIHSSLNNMLPMYTGNINDLLSSLLSYCKINNITLVMPTFFNGSNYQAKEYYENEKNIFDVRKTISGTGLLSEIFRRTKDVERSIHPTHSICAFGPLAGKLTRSHHLADTTFGEGTPFYEMTKYKTKILGLGTKGIDTGTQIHSAEDILRNKYPIVLYSQIIPVNCVDQLGNNLIYNLRIRKREYDYDWKSVSKILKKIGTKWTYKGIPFFLTEANVITEAAIEEARKGRTIYKEINI